MLVSKALLTLGDSQRQSSGVGLWGLLWLKTVKAHVSSTCLEFHSSMLNMYAWL